MRYRVTVGGLAYEVEIDASGRVEVDGEEIGVDISELSAEGLSSFVIDHDSHDILVQPASSEHSEYRVELQGARYAVKVEDLAGALIAAALPAPRPPRQITLNAPMPGLIISVLVEPGQRVVEGEVLLTLEAMKMENELRAPRAGVIEDVRAQPGSAVKLNDSLVTIR